MTQRVGLVVRQLLLQDFLASEFATWGEYVDALAAHSRPRPAMYQGTWLTDTLVSQGVKEMKRILAHSEQLQQVMIDPVFAGKVAKKANGLGQFAREWTEKLGELADALSITAVQLPSN